jgi:ABC-type phosphate transport system substrate-binding protein
MKNRAIVLGAILLVAVLLVVGLPLIKGILTQSAQAQQATINNPAKRQKWEYCAIVEVDSYVENNKDAIGFTSICYIREMGLRCEKIESKIAGGTEKLNKALDDALAKAIAKLGNEGWEMVGEAVPFKSSILRSKAARTLYFRRPQL